ncbi:hypothetical protein SUGI_0561030 [Cryptomeria japonica]|nr:hypothetical protein SUGI_0561030 [Cryptomeria japonica]
MNFDGASKGNPQLSGYKAVVRDEEGNLMGAVCCQADIVSNNITEITALEDGLKWETANGITKVVIEGDSKVILNGVINHHFMNWRLNSWIPRMYSHLQKLKDYNIQHIFHKGNQVADLLANHGIAKILPPVLSPKNAGSLHGETGGLRKGRRYRSHGRVVLEVYEEWTSILGLYFNPLAILFDAECSDPEDKIRLAAEALRMKKVKFMAEAWEVFRVGVKNAYMGPFRRMMMKEDGWLSEGSIDKVATIGMHVATILRLM